METQLRFVLIILGALVIAGVLFHGIWTIRKNDKLRQDAQADLKDTSETGNRDDQGFDQFGVSEPRVIAEPIVQEAPVVEEKKEPSFGEVEVEKEPEPVQMDFELHTQEEQEPEPESVIEEPAPVEASEPEEPPVAEDVIVLHVLAHDDKSISGAALLPKLLTLGLKFGDMDIFHRHQDSAGTGPVLFSLANMLNPGTFNLDEMETANIQGLSLFMQLPNAGDAHQAFSMMLNAAEQLADEFECQVLDAQRSVMTKQTAQHCVEKIREFERQKLLTP